MGRTTGVAPGTPLPAGLWMYVSVSIVSCQDVGACARTRKRVRRRAVSGTAARAGRGTWAGVTAAAGGSVGRRRRTACSATCIWSLSAGWAVIVAVAVSPASSAASVCEDQAACVAGVARRALNRGSRGRKDAAGPPPPTHTHMHAYVQLVSERVCTCVCVCEGERRGKAPVPGGSGRSTPPRRACAMLCCCVFPPDTEQRTVQRPHPIPFRIDSMARCDPHKPPLPRGRAKYLYVCVCACACLRVHASLSLSVRICNSLSSLTLSLCVCGVGLAAPRPLHRRRPRRRPARRPRRQQQPTTSLPTPLYAAPVWRVCVCACASVYVFSLSLSLPPSLSPRLSLSACLPCRDNAFALATCPCLGMWAR
jgi:hypothetical protein